MLKRNKIIGFTLAITLVQGFAPMHLPNILGTTPGLIKQASAAEIVTINNVTYVVYSDYARVRSGTLVEGSSWQYTCGNPNASGDVIIEEEVNGVPVTEIGKYAFYNCDGITSIKLPKTISSIEKSAFYGCRNMEGVVDVSNLDYIDESAFCFCSKTEFTGIFSGVSIGSQAFHGCENTDSCITLKGNSIKVQTDSFGTLYPYLGTLILDTTKFLDVGNHFNAPDEGRLIRTIYSKAPVDACFDSQNILYALYSDGTASVAGGGKPSTDNLVIPKTVSYKGVIYTVTTMDCHAFNEIVPKGTSASIGSNNKLTSLTIPSTVTAISDYSINNCPSLSYIEISNESISNASAISSCPKAVVKAPKSFVDAQTDKHRVYFYDSDGVDCLASFAVPTNTNMSDYAKKIGTAWAKDSGSILGNITQDSVFILSGELVKQGVDTPTLTSSAESTDNRASVQVHVH